MGKVGLDGHDRGAKVVMMALRDAGMEVIYSGLHQTPEALVRAAVEEDVDLIGISILSGAHNTLIPKVMKKLKSEGLAHVAVYVGGIIPAADIPKLKKAGVRQVFTPGTLLEDIVNWAKLDAARIRKGGRKK
jgi:methylmalonyl-CoA mutase C-terminal domain/subunit